jgi:hypothetical protein
VQNATLEETVQRAHRAMEGDSALGKAFTKPLKVLPESIVGAVRERLCQPGEVEQTSLDHVAGIEAEGADFILPGRQDGAGVRGNQIQRLGR